MRRVTVSRTGRVECRASLELRLPATAVWGQIRDFSRYARQDIFHADPHVEGIPRAGAEIAVSHRYAIFRVRRVGRILVWHEGIGYSFSDLSKRGPRRGFPHVFSYRVETLDSSTSRLHVVVRGRWTAFWVPRALVRLWLWWVFAHVVRSIHNELLLYQLWRKRRDVIASAR